MSKTKTMIVSRSRAVHPLLTPLTRWNCAERVSDLVILRVTFDAKMTFALFPVLQLRGLVL